MKKKKSLKEELEYIAKCVFQRNIVENSLQYIVPETFIIETLPKGRIKISFEVKK